MLDSPGRGGPGSISAAIEKHHTKGVKTSTKDLQLLTRDKNKLAALIEGRVDAGRMDIRTANAILKPEGIQIQRGGVKIGAPDISPEKQIKDLKKYVERKTLEKFAAKNVKGLTPQINKSNIELTTKPSMIKGAFKAAKPVLKALPLVGTALGVYDVGKAVQAGITDPRDLFAAYQVSAEVAAKNKRMREDPEFRRQEMTGLPAIMTEDEIEEDFTSYFNGGIVAVKGVI